jgi:hypothetical protein
MKTKIQTQTQPKFKLMAEAITNFTKQFASEKYPAHISLPWKPKGAPCSLNEALMGRFGFETLEALKKAIDELCADEQYGIVKVPVAGGCNLKVIALVPKDQQQQEKPAKKTEKPNYSALLGI